MKFTTRLKMLVGKSRGSSVVMMLALAIIFAVVSQVSYLWTMEVLEKSVEEAVLPVRRTTERDATARSKSIAKRQILRKQRLGVKMEDPKVVLAEKALSKEALLKIHPDAYQNCTSPENVEWPLGGDGDVRSLLNERTCGMGVAEHAEENIFRWHFQNDIIKEQIKPRLSQEQCHLVVFGVAFGEEYLRDMNATTEERGGPFVNSTALLEKHGRCFFMFTLEENMENAGISYSAEPSLLGHTWLIPIPQHKLPYQSHRRNAKLLKYMGHYAFPNSKTIIWQDAKFFRPNSLFDRSIPSDYSNLWNSDSDTTSTAPCVQTMALPIHESSYSDLYTRVSMGETSRFDISSSYQDHCKTIISALKARPNVTDNPQGLLQQCQFYLRNVMEGNSTVNNPLNYGLIDSAFIVWNESTEHCRAFNSQLRCTLLDQLHCHSDRDQIMIPFVLHKLLNGQAETSRLQAMYRPHGKAVAISVDNSWHSRYHDLDFVSTDNDSQRQIFLRTIRSACHWYHTYPIGKNPEQCFRKDWLSERHFHDDGSDILPEDMKAKLVRSIQQAQEKTNEPQAVSTFQNCSRFNATAPTCILEDASNSFRTYLQELQEQTIQPLLTECQDLVVFGTALGINNLMRLEGVLRRHASHFVIKQPLLHDKCFFTFVFEEDVNQLKIELKKPGFKIAAEQSHNTTAFFYEYQWLVPISKSILTENEIQHEGIDFKYMSSLLFPGVKNTIWQSAEFFEPHEVIHRPENYRDLITAAPVQNSCVTAFASPGTLDHSRGAQYVEVCHRRLFGHQPESAVMQQLFDQCDKYIQHVYERELSVDYLNYGVVSTNFLIWNESTETCRKFNEKLRCKMLRELECGSGFDTLAFPYALYELGLHTEYKRKPRIPVDNAYNRRIHDLKFVQRVPPQTTVEGVVARYVSQPAKRDMVTVVRTLCHWGNGKRVGEACPTFKKIGSAEDLDKQQQQAQQQSKLLRATTTGR